jgi:monoamine oxidase
VVSERKAVSAVDHASRVGRRDVLKLAAIVLAGSRITRMPRAAVPPARVATKRVIVTGGGIAGLSCAYELMKRGHDVTLLEASGRTGGHVRTIRDPFQDGLYVDAGAQNFQMVGKSYELYRSYVNEFGLTPLYFPQTEIALQFISGKMYTPEMLHDRSVLASLGFNAREREFLAHETWGSLASLYFGPYTDRFKDEYKPFEAGLDDLDRIRVLDLLRRDGASSAAQAHIGSLESSALHAVWQAAILKIRGVPMVPGNYRLKGGNQMMTDAFASRLGDRIRLGCPVTGIRHGTSGVTVQYRESGGAKKMEAEYLVCCISAPMLSELTVTPPFPAAKAYAIRNVAYYTAARVAFQCRTPFWERDKVSPSMEFGERNLGGVWRIAEEVATHRALLEGSADPGTTPDEALAAFRKLYPGKSEDIEQAFVYDWSQDPWCTFCETVTLPPGQLPKVWPRIIEPEGRIHFAGAYADNMCWGMEAATRSANRTAKAIDEA